MATQDLSDDFIDFRPEELEEVRRRRILAFCVDYLAIAVLSAIAGVVVFFLGIVTFGLGWLLFGGIVPFITLVYFAVALARPEQASPGMKLFSIRIQREDGRRVDFLFAVLHTILFWVGNMILPGIILLVSLFSSKKRLAHDILLGSVFVRSDT